jgi:hypothetical protein
MLFFLLYLGKEGRGCLVLENVTVQTGLCMNPTSSLLAAAVSSDGKFWQFGAATLSLFAVE